MNDGRRLGRGGCRLRVKRDVAEQQVGLGRLDEVGTLQLARHVAREREDRRMVAARFIEAGDEMRAAGTGRTGTYGEAAGGLGLAGGGEGLALLVAAARARAGAAASRLWHRGLRGSQQTRAVGSPQRLQATHP